MRSLLLLCLALPFGGVAHANGRAPLTNGIHFNATDPHSMYVATTFGLLISHDDGCTMDWICEQNIGYGGEWDPKYAIGADGTIYATTYTGLRVSHDGGCSFVTATSELAPGSPNRIADIWIDALDVGPTGLVWVGTAESGQPNEVYLSSDDGVSFHALGLNSSTIFWKSLRAAPSNMARAYLTGYETATVPAAHIYRTDNLGGTWTPSPLVGVVYGSTPLLLLEAVDPTNADIVFMISEGSYNSQGDRLYRSSDAGMTWTDVFDAAGPIKDVVIKDSSVFVTTMMQSGMTFIGGAAYRSADGGLTFDQMPAAPQLACLGNAPNGDLIGCGANWQPDYQAVTRSTDVATTFAKVWRFVELAGPLKCPAGTAEYDMCDQEQWDSLKAQFAATGPTCGSNIVPVDDPPNSGDPSPKKSGGCCDSAPAPVGIMWIALLAIWLMGSARRRRAPSSSSH